MMWSLKDFAAWIRGCLNRGAARIFARGLIFPAKTTAEHMQYHRSLRSLFLEVSGNFCYAGNFVCRQPGSRRCENARKSTVGDEHELPAACQPPQLLWVLQQAALARGQGSDAGSCLLLEVKADAGLKQALPTYSPHTSQGLRG